MKYRFFFLAVLFSLSLSQFVHAQDGVLIDYVGTTRDASAVLDVRSSSQGALVPRLTFAQRNAIVSPATSLLIFQTDNAVGNPTGYYYNSGTPGSPVWTRFFEGTGNNNTTGGGTQNYVAKWNNAGGTTIGNSQIFDNGTNVGVGNANPLEKLHVSGGLRVESGQLNTGTDHLRIMDGVRADDNSYEWTGFYSGTTRQGIILYDGAWSGANNLTNEFSITAENGNLLTLNTSGNHIALMPDGAGNVGIGTTAPFSRLMVTVPSTNTIPVVDASSTAGITIAGTGDLTRLQMGVGGTTLGPYGGWIQTSYSGGPTGRLLLNPIGGEVGIGITNPTARLTVRMGSTDPGAYSIGKALFVSSAMLDGKGYNGGVEFRHDNLSQGIGFGYNTIYQTGFNANNELNIIAKGSGNVTINSYGGATGNVGIGTTSPSEKLEVNGKLKLTGDPYQMSRTPRVIHVEDVRGGCPGLWGANQSLIRTGVTVSNPAMIMVTSSMIRNQGGRADLELRVGTNTNPDANPIVDRALTYTSASTWENAYVHWSGPIPAGTTSVSITSPQANVWGCGTGWGSIDIIVFEQ